MRNLVKNLASSVVLRGAGALLSVTLSVVLARLLGAEQYGIYSFCITIVSLLVVPSQFGVGVILVRFCAAYEKQKKWSLLKGLLKWANQFVLVTSICISLLSFILVSLFPNLLGETYSNTFLLSLILLPILALGEIRAASLRGFRKFIKGQMPEQIIRPLALLIVVAPISYYNYGSNVGATKIMALYLAITLFSFLVGAWWLYKAIPLGVKQIKVPDKNIKTWLGAVGTISFTQGGKIILTKIDMIFVGAIAGPEAAGIYKVASTLSMLLAFGLGSVAPIVGPMLSRLHVADDRKNQKAVFLFSCIVSLCIAGPIAALLIIYGQDIITFIYGAEFSGAYILLCILVVGQLINAMTGSAGSVLNMTGQERKALLAVVTSVAISLPLYFVYVSDYDAIGAAWISSGSLMFLNLVLFVFAWNVVNNSNSKP